MLGLYLTKLQKHDNVYFVIYIKARKIKIMTKIVRSLRSGQITIPSDFREKLGIDADTLLQVSLIQGELRIKPVQLSQKISGSPWIKEAYEAFTDIRKELKKYSEEEINQAIDKAVKAVRKSHVNSST